MTSAPQEPAIDRPRTRPARDIREVLFAVVLLVACVMVVAGVDMVSRAAGLITGGVLLAGWSYLVLSE